MVGAIEAKAMPKVAGLPRPGLESAMGDMVVGSSLSSTTSATQDSLLHRA